VDYGRAALSTCKTLILKAIGLKVNCAVRVSGAGRILTLSRSYHWNYTGLFVLVVFGVRQPLQLAGSVVYAVAEPKNGGSRSGLRSPGASYARFAGLGYV